MRSIHDREAVEAWALGAGIKPAELKRFRNAFYKRFEVKETALAGRLAEQFEFCALREVARHDSAVDGATRLVFETGRGNRIETVILRIASGRTSLCLSTQAGCAAACRFCATGSMGLRQNLSRVEMVEQVMEAGRLLAGEGRRVRNLVFMGMGEPFHNEEELFGALEILLSGAAFNFSANRIVVSSVGVPEGMVRCARRFPEVRQALSLHSARQAVRRELMPMSERAGVDALRGVVGELNGLQEAPVFIEYLMLAGLTDRMEDLEALVGFVRDRRVHLNLIPFNPAPGAVFEGSAPGRIKEFSQVLRQEGLPVTVRYSLGRDIAAACGQLALRGK